MTKALNIYELHDEKVVWILAFFPRGESHVAAGVTLPPA